jgi:hypothetical protein
MTDNLRAFLHSVRLHVEGVKEDVIPAYRAKVVTDVGTDIIRLTRVRKPGGPITGGTARGGWQMTVGAPATGQTGRKVRGDGAQMIAEETRGLDTAPLGETSYWSNNVHYIRYLNDGTDRFAGDRMVQRAVLNQRGVLYREGDFS